MNFNEIMKNYRAKLVKEGIIKSVVCGAIFGFFALLVFEAVNWFTALNLAWLGAVVFVAFGAGFTELFYFKKFRPNKKQIAERVDALGLEERVITMNELEGDDSYIAQKQREDTLQALNTVHAGLLSLTLSVPLIITLVLSFLCGAGMTTVSALSEKGVIMGGNEIIDPIVNPSKDDEEKFVSVTYDVYTVGGNIDGELFQVLEAGQDASPVLAVAEDGYAFYMWTDGSEDPYRLDTNIQEDMEILALFQPAQEGEGEGNGDSDGDQPGDQPGDGEGESNDPSDSDDPGPGAGGKYEATNQVYDGATFYGGEVYENAYQDAVERMAQDTGLSDAEKKIINEYYKIIAK